jgi:hypothetical protein
MFMKVSLARGSRERRAKMNRELGLISQLRKVSRKASRPQSKLNEAQESSDKWLNPPDERTLLYCPPSEL